jgi:prolipoprotein diacylglyceryltransferase/protein-S-isoprenylcysteine O-methyltransferase Ste14
MNAPIAASGERFTGFSGVRITMIVIAYIFVFWALLPAFLFVAGMSLDSLVPLSLPDRSWLKPLAILIASVGGGGTVWGMGQLWWQGRGYPISHLPPERFVARGLYRWRRHPIYIGYTLLFVGAALLIGSFWSVFFAGGLLLALWIWYAKHVEEPVLRERFGRSYDAYRHATPLLIPRRTGRAFSAIFTPAYVRLLRPLNRLANFTVAFRAGPYILVTYGVLVALGAFIALTILGGLLSSSPLPSAPPANGISPLSVVLIGIPVSGMIGAKLFWFMAHRKHSTHPLRRVGFVSWGGLLAVMIFLYLEGNTSGQSPLVAADAFMRVMFIAYAVGRLGCLSYGCCYGMPKEGEGIRYVNPGSKAIREHGADGVVRHATQISSFFVGSLLIVVLNLLAMLGPAPGTITAVGLIIYGMARAFVEPYRDRKRVLGEVLTEGHLGCIACVLIGWLMLASLPPGPADAGSMISLWQGLVGGIPFLLPAALGSVAVLLVMGSHWKEIGTW